jgi:hypothetical protein
VVKRRGGFWTIGRRGGDGIDGLVEEWQRAVNGVICRLQLKVSFEIDDLVGRKKVTHLKQIMVME